jgi:phage tail sheath gpL-like
MGVEASAVARVVGVTAEYKNLRGGDVLFLPQRIVLLGQGNSDASYPDTKYQITSATMAAARYGYGSPIHLAARELFPANGDGVGTIPVTVYPLVDDDSAVAAEGEIDATGTTTEAASYTINVSGIASDAFVIAAGLDMADGNDLHVVLLSMYHAINDVLEMPVIADFTYGNSEVTFTGTGNGTFNTFSVVPLGGWLPGVYTLTCNTAVANGGVFTLTNPEGDVVSSSITMTPGVGGSTIFTNVGGLNFTLTDGAINFAEGDEFEIELEATSLILASKWAGASANDIVVEVVDDLGDLTFTITQPTGGLVNPEVDDAIAQIGGVWETLVLNCMNPEDSTTLDTLQTWGEGRWGTVVKKPLICFVGCTSAVVATATNNTETRTDDRVNCQLVAPGSPNLPLVVAARQLARIAKVANDNPPTDYAGQTAASLTAGTDGEQWTYAQRDVAVKAGSSTVEVNDGVVSISDVVTPYNTGDPPPAYRYVCDIVKLQNIIFNLDLIFASSDWAGKVLVPDDQVVVNPNARKPKTAKAAVNAMLDSLGEQAIISDPKTAKTTTTSVINSQNPKRLDVATTVQLSGNACIIDVGLNFGFYFGAAA